MSACARCGGTFELIVGDATVVCRGCVVLLTDIADRPETASERLRMELLTEHPNVKLVRRVGAGNEFVWAWVH